MSAAAPASFRSRRRSSGGDAIGVEIDPAANGVARANALKNGLSLSFETKWPDGTFDVVVANILREILVFLAPEVVARVAGLLVLSGLVNTDVPVIIARYAPLLGQGYARPEIFERGPWRTLVWRLSSTAR